ncbi:MAG TPA: hypothetical protein VK875_05545 [Euzebyales bacterium]|nr:hypothetical protein [Euzebyales bacterium]
MALVLAVCLLSACSGGSREPVDHADPSPPTRTPFPPPTRSAPERAEPEPFVAGTFDLDVIGEASGLARSVRNPDVVYVLDDGPGSTGVLALDIRADRATTVTVAGFEGRDTEGLAVGPCGARGRRSCLFIGDIGNNQGAWTSVDVWRVREPDLSRTDGAITVRGDVATYTYPDAPVDAEALLVERGRPFLITKESRPEGSSRTSRPRLLAARGFADGQLRDLGPIPLPLPASGGWAAALYGNVVTDAELVDGRVVLRTYDHVMVYTPHRPGARLRTLARWAPEEIDTPRMPQGEAVTMDHCGIWLASEQVDSVWLVPWRSPPPDDADDAQEQACPNGSAHS